MAFTTIKGAGGREIKVPTGLFIDNQFSPAADGSTVAIENPATGEIIDHVAAAQLADVNRAVASSKTAFTKTWRAIPPAKRRALLYKLGDLIEQHGEEFASIEAVDAGMLYHMSLGMSVPRAAETARYFAGWTDKLDGQSLDIDMGLAYTKREPIGVCAAVIPWNSPLMITLWKLGPAIAAGNTLIIKTPELAPLYGQKLAELIKEADFPPGVINIICGLGNVAGQALADHMEVRKLSFTGSEGVGRTILTSAARSNLKRIGLELGGKGPSIVFEDADWEIALQWATLGITAHNGQICAAGSRIYVQDSIYDKFVAEFSKRAKEAVAGDPLLPETTKGPVISENQKKRILGYLNKAKQEGTKLLHGGDADSVSNSKGHYVPNTAFTEVSADAIIMKEEVFGPVASIARFKTEEEVIALANDSNYGLAASIFTTNVNRAVRVSDQIEAGMITVNTWGAIHANTPFGGIKQSGFGRELGQDSLGDWTQVKSVKLSITRL